MVVIPTKNEVHLHYGYSTWDTIGYLATFAGLALLFVLHRSRRQELPVINEDPIVSGPPGDNTSANSAWAPASNPVDEHDERELVDATSGAPLA
jgi:hypothetical protein